MWRRRAWKSGRHLWQHAHLGARASADCPQPGSPGDMRRDPSLGSQISQLLPSPSGHVVRLTLLEHSRVGAPGVHAHGVQGLWGERGP